MNKDKLAAVEQYLHIHYPEGVIEHREDFDRCAQTFKVHLKDRKSLLLKVADEVLDDTSADELPHTLDRFEAAEAAEREAQDSGILVTNNGLQKFKR